MLQQQRKRQEAAAAAEAAEESAADSGGAAAMAEEAAAGSASEARGLGGAGGGWFYSLHGISGVFLLCSIAAIIWFMVAIRMKKPPQLATRMYNIHDFSSSDKSAVQEQLNKLTGVHDVYTCEDDDTLYLKIDSQSFNENDLESMGYQTNIQD